MFTIYSKNRSGDCEGNTRRDFLKVGAIGSSMLTLPNLLRARSAQAAEVNNKSVIWIWLAGGPTHVETFDPKMTAPSEYHSITGEAKTPLPGVSMGGTFPKMAACMDKMALIRSFAHGNSSHGNGTRWVMTGYDDRQNMKPSIGSIAARQFGTTNPITGIPTYIRMNNIASDGPGWLGTGYSPFNPNGPAVKNMASTVPEERFSSRRALLNSLDTINRTADNSGKLEGMDVFEQQAFDLVRGTSRDAFNIAKADPKERARYGKGLGETLLTARRLCEAGCAFVTVSYGGWDMHGGIVKGLQGRAEQMDQGIAALIEDLDERGMLEDTLVVITGEFGRTPKINTKGGRDHWGRLCTLALAGGGLKMGQVVGESSAKIEVPATKPITPQDLMATIFHMYGMDPGLQFISNQGRPTYLIEDGAPIAELI
ncbi:MAG: DUF1501 domain-containing protein [Planctomycetota bacterium]|nr:DUF1501 domain-containing protein [Planctomycetota bacterium]